MRLTPAGQRTFDYVASISALSEIQKEELIDRLLSFQWASYHAGYDEGHDDGFLEGMHT